ncbi:MULTISPECIES: HAMP domain-containing sensor histidine kinase [unclassified Sporolactobacillus]|uniref:HAMP domain-containing sensor histidine kinase n=1 Tax=unclassified Sporolactobacillus TaxID=2628533 RepID=UPI002367423D|nr:HAMP domain-containing sensor histidine kinase [Sporolactobacillus sp. CQH2019]MDD9149428.1 HAMP domain-containing sensor histidine kinase [Sporolactobacillus sp. CQH2019]
MFRWTLAKRIWLSFALLVMIIGIIMVVVYPYSIQSALKEDSYETIEQEQLQNVLHQDAGNYGVDNSGSGFLDRQQAVKSVGNLLIDSNYRQILGNSIPASVFNEMKGHIKQQKASIQRYELVYRGSTLYYVVRRVNVNMETGYLISYMWNTYTNELMHKLWARLIFIFVLTGILGLFIAFWLARYLKRPLDILGSRFEEISRLNWEKPFEWKGDYEFERLSSQFEKMRLNLMRYDESQKVFLQQASHELKTPIMVVHSYAQSVKDGIYPKGDLMDSMDVIIHESEQMEKRVRKLLYFTRFDSLRDQKIHFTRMAFGDIALFIKKRLKTQRPDIRIHVSGEETAVWGDKEQWQTVFENLVENGLRYAKQNIWVTAEERNGETIMVVENDGRKIPENEMEAMFEPFKKGEKGQFGLGLAIVKRIVLHHRGGIRVENSANGVAFIITVPAPPKDKRLPPAQAD